jgi:hypothetical protein
MFVSQFKSYFTAFVSFHPPPDCSFLRAQRMHAVVKMPVVLRYAFRNVAS